MNIIAVWWKSEKYSIDYPKVLAHSLKEQDLDLVVLTNSQEDLDCRAEYLRRAERFKGWWAVAELFSPEFTHLRPCLYLDLDTYVLGDLGPLLNLDPARFWCLSDFNRPQVAEAGHMVIPKRTEAIWHACRRSDHRIPGAVIGPFAQARIQDAVPGILSYKRHKLQDQKPDCLTVSFHGKPKPHETTGWAKEYWDARLT